MFNIDFKKIFIIGLALLLPILSINMEQKQSETTWYNTPLEYLMGFVQETFYTFTTGVRQTTSQYLDLVNLKKEAQDIKEQNRELLAKFESLNEIQRENDRLKELLEFKKSTKMDLLAARIIGRDVIPDHNTITINRGTRDGIQAGQAVITVGGAVGFIFRPTKFISHVMLITDRYAVADGIVQRSRAHGIVEGRNVRGCVLQYVERTEDVKPGDLVVTGSLDNIFPKGFPLAVVESVERKTFSVSLKVDLKPVVDANKIEEVFIIRNAGKEDFGERFSPNSNTESDGNSKVSSASNRDSKHKSTESSKNRNEPSAGSNAATENKAVENKDSKAQKSPTPTSDSIEASMGLPKGIN